MSGLTARQAQVLWFVQSETRHKGIAPTHREICEHFGFSSYGTAYKHLRILEEKGHLKKSRNQRRGLEVTTPTIEQIKRLMAELAPGARIVITRLAEGFAITTEATS